jgi:nitrogen fixation protein FixH
MTRHSLIFYNAYLMNWGTGIIIFFSLFAISMISAVVATTRYAPQLVQKDYYALDINYQQHLEKKQNTAAMASEPKIQLDRETNNLQIAFPEGMTARTGNVKCYRSITTKDDINTQIENAQTLNIPTAQFSAGRWHVEMDWEDSSGKPYFWETTFSK